MNTTLAKYEYDIGAMVLLYIMISIWHIWVRCHMTEKLVSIGWYR